MEKRISSFLAAGFEFMYAINAFLFSVQSFDYKITLNVVDMDRTNIFISTELDREIQ
jgi:hypothetical protein